jgi:hypothetical protein
MSLFDNYERTDNSPSPESEDPFTFLNRSARPDVQNIRTELERWFAAYPAEHQADLRGQFRSTRAHQHEAAWWELYLHRLFTLLGFAVEVHPELDGVSTRPDFKLSGPTGEFLLEAATTHAGIVNPQANETREGWVIDALNTAPHPNFMTGLAFEQVGAEKPSTAQVVGPVTAWLDGLDPDELLEGHEYPVQHFAFRGFRIRLRALPKAPGSRGVSADDLLVGMRSGGAGPVNDTARLLGKLRDKSGKYGDPGLPILVAVNLISSFGEPAAETALFGSYAIQIPLDGSSAGQTIRNQDEFWMRNGKPLGTRVSAVLEGRSLNPWVVAREWPRLWHNPWATRPLALDTPFPEGIGDQSGRVEYRDAAAPPASLFGLTDDWPGPLR